MKKLQVLFSAGLLLAGLALTGTAGAECACKAQKGLKGGWFTGTGTVAAKTDAKAGSCCKSDAKADAKAGSCCSTKSDAKADAKAGSCCSTKSDAKADDAKAGSCCSGKN